MVKIAPSILAGDHGRIALEAKNVESWGADWIHIDIMDGAFAPNLTFGPGVVKSIRREVKIPLDCHLMIEHPERFADRFLKAGGDYITVHAEAVSGESLKAISDMTLKAGKKLGIAFKPDTALDVLSLDNLNLGLVTVMSVNPGFSGQKFMRSVEPKISKAKEIYRGKGIEIEVDGGVDIENARAVCDLGASVLVAGNSVFGQEDPKKALFELKRQIALSAE